MIKIDQVIPLIISACPSFQDIWYESDNKELLYVVMGELARHLLSLFQRGETDEFNPLFELIERFHTEGDDYVRELATIGLLEGIQNNWTNNDQDPEVFIEFLLPETKKWWDELNDFWDGKIPYVGAGLR